MELAGYDEAEQAATLRASVEKLRSQLEATKVSRLSVPVGGNGGSIVQEFIDVDHATQRAAAVELIEIVGAKASRTANAGPSGLQVNILVREAEPQATKVEVVEVKGNPA